MDTNYIKKPSETRTGSAKTKRSLKNPDLLHVKNHDDLALVNACGLSINRIARIMGYATSGILYGKFNKYKNTDEPFTVALSTLVECALWRAGLMPAYINAKKRRDGHDAINWDKLPPQLDPISPT